VGYTAGAAVTTGTRNTLIGGLVGSAVTTGSNNVAVGLSALAANTTGEYNVAVGAIAGDAITTGSLNTAVGYNTLGAATTAAGNTALGAQALAVATGASNTAVGQNAGVAVTTATDNTIIGRIAGSGVTTGSTNVIIGYQAALHSVIQTTGSNHVLVGANTRCTSASANNANGLGFNLACLAGYTTVGNADDDIRAAHGNITWATVSDERVKKDIVDSTVGLNFINDLRPVTFDFKNKGDLPKEFSGYEEGSTEVYKNKKTQHGFIAQEVKAAIDKHSDIKDGFSMWDENDKAGQQRVGEAALIPVLVKAIQELSAEVEKLKGA